MDQFSALLNQGAASAWWFLPTALSLGALHGLEPGHSKSLMAAFIITVRGTWQQAVTLGLCVAVSHSLIVWCIAAVGLYFGPEAQALLSEGRLSQISGGLLMLVASWMLWNLLRLSRPSEHMHDGHQSHHEHASRNEHCDHSHNQDSSKTHEHNHYKSDQNQNGDIAGRHVSAINVSDTAALCAHDLAHARDIQRRFANGRASWGQIIVFGLSGGLLPCPASVAVLALCLQAQQVAVGFALVAAFSLGLALTLMLSGLIAAIGFKHAQQRVPWINRIGVYAPWLSTCLMLVLGGYLIIGE